VAATRTCADNFPEPELWLTRDTEGLSSGGLELNFQIRRDPTVTTPGTGHRNRQRQILEARSSARPPSTVDITPGLSAAGVK
jgi:hypothetical protein